MPAVGQRPSSDGVACLWGCALGNLLSEEGVRTRVRARERARCVRYLYTLLLWASERMADRVRARRPRAHTGSRRTLSQVTES